MAKIDFKSAAILALPVTVAVWGVSYIFGKVGIGINQLFSSVDVTSGITPTAGNKILSFIGGYIPLNFTIPNIAILFLSAWVAILIGSWFVTKTNIAFKGTTGRLASIILWGALPVYLLLVGFKIPPVSAIIGLAIHTFIVAYLAGWVGGLMKKSI